MKLEIRPLAHTHDTILVHNVAYAGGRTAIRKGTILGEKQIKLLETLGHKELQVAVLEQDDIAENEAAARLSATFRSPLIKIGKPAGGRLSFRATQLSLLNVDAARLLALNMLPGVTLATRNQHSVLAESTQTADFATLKIIPYAIPQATIDAALNIICQGEPLLHLRPIPVNKQVALLLTGEPAVHTKLRDDFKIPIETRLNRLQADLATIETVPIDVNRVREASKRLTESHDLLIVAGQTSIMDIDDTTPRGLTEAGATITVYGAPVEPGNLLTLAYFPGTPVMCAPGCARSLAMNIVDMLLPRLLLGDRLEQQDIAQYGLGGYLKTR
ncbi:MAG: molybdopterin-binding protein [Chloroflexota bacterium]